MPPVRPAPRSGAGAIPQCCCLAPPCRRVAVVRRKRASRSRATAANANLDHRGRAQTDHPSAARKLRRYRQLVCRASPADRRLALGAVSMVRHDLHCLASIAALATAAAFIDGSAPISRTGFADAHSGESATAVARPCQRSGSLIQRPLRNGNRTAKIRSNSVRSALRNSVP